MSSKTTSILVRGALLALLASALFAGSASAAPAWKFNGTALTGTETILGGAEKSGLTVPGMTTTCDNFLYKLTISNNKSGTGEGSVTELPLYSCYTDGVCEVEAITAEKLPWASNLVSVGGSSYITIKGIHVGILYSGAECVLGGFLVEVEGSAGGLINNTTESATFSPTSFKATGTSLTSFGEEVEWNGVFPTEAFQWHRQEALTVS
jgi:hypothetical protein